jgi:hypothetical protein
MDVWDPNEKTAEFGQIKKAINTPVSGFKQVTRAIVWGIFIVFYFFIFVLLLAGCSYLKKDSDEIIITDLPPLEQKTDVVACIKMQDACND